MAHGSIQIRELFNLKWALVIKGYWIWNQFSRPAVLPAFKKFSTKGPRKGCRKRQVTASLPCSFPVSLDFVSMIYLSAIWCDDRHGDGDPL